MKRNTKTAHSPVIKSDARFPHSNPTANNGPGSNAAEINHIVVGHWDESVNRINKADEAADKGMSRSHRSISGTIDPR